MGFYKNTNGVLTPIAGGISNSYAPIGAIYPYGGSSAPSGYLMCDGSAVSRTDYSALFAVIGTSFGAGDGSTTFNVPDLREATTKGVGLSGKSNNHYDADGVALGEFIEDRLQGHEHKAYANASKAVFTAAGGSGMDNRTSLNTNGIATDGSNGDPRTGATTEVKAVGVNYIIKAKDVNLSGGTQTLADRVEALETVTSGTITRETSRTTGIGEIYLKKTGKMVMMHCNLEGCSLQEGQILTYAQIPSGFRPDPAISWCVCTVDYAVEGLRAWVQSTGGIQMLSPITTVASIRLQAVYIAES